MNTFFVGQPGETVGVERVGRLLDPVEGEDDVFALPDLKAWTATISEGGGLREESDLSLRAAHPFCCGSWVTRAATASAGADRPIPGRVYWIHEEEPAAEEWDGEVETAENVALLADSFTDFVARIGPKDHSE